MTSVTLTGLSNIDVVNLDEELVNQSKLYMIFEVAHAYVSDKYVRSDAQLKYLESKLSLQYEYELNAKNERATDKKIEKLVESNSEFHTAVMENIDLKNYVVTLSNILKGLDNRKDMIMQLSSKRNKEIGAKMV